ncbi:MAG TPA: prohibitin family protein, partial [Polyangiaceae bacterium]|nr:prohibitin family protein [Polyangiaceae bacterium]
VKYFGAVQPVALPEGIHFIRPYGFATVVAIDTKLRTVEEEAHSASKDLQNVMAKVVVQYSIQAPAAPRLVQNFGQEIDIESTTLRPGIQESVKVITSRYTAEELVTQRESVKLGIVAEIKHFVDTTLKEKAVLGSVRLANVSVKDFMFSPEFNAAIEQKVRAEQDALRAENEKRQRVTQAEAAAAEKKLAADAVAYQTEVESKARAAAIERESKALQANPGLIQLRTVERWNGVLPTYTGNSIPMMKFVQ